MKRGEEMLITVDIICQVLIFMQISWLKLSEKRVEYGHKISGIFYEAKNSRHDITCKLIGFNEVNI